MKFNTEEAEASDDFVEKSFTGPIWKQVKEALVNEVFHKSYREPEPVEIRIYVDSIQIINYPGLANGCNYRNGRIDDKT